MRYISRRLVIVVAIFGCIIAPSTRAQNWSPGRVALSGYDPVSYFTVGHPEMGSPQFTHALNGANYLFVSEQHRRLFAADPERYAPQFNGYCAISMSQGIKYDADPEAWAIQNGKLYVFGSKEGVPQFKANPETIAGKANAAWVKLKTN